jgi:hypothetical protein
MSVDQKNGQVVFPRPQEEAETKPPHAILVPSHTVYTQARRLAIPIRIFTRKKRQSRCVAKSVFCQGTPISQHILQRS